MTQVLRPYQTECVQAVMDSYEQGYRRVLYTLPTGTGKTTTFSELIKQFLANDWKVLVLAHRVELIQQAFNRIKEHNDLDYYEIGAEIADVYAPRSASVVVGSVMTVKGAHRLDWFKPDAIIVDECFPAGTLVDSKPIETLHAGDFVRSWNHRTNRVEMRPIKSLFKKQASGLVRVTLIDGKQIICTPGHPFYSDGKYIHAYRLTSQDWVQCTIQQAGGMVHNDGQICEETDLRGVRNGVSAEVVEQLMHGDMLGGVQGDTAGAKAKSGNDALHNMRQRSGVQRRARVGAGKARTSILFCGVQRCVRTIGQASLNAACKSQGCFDAHESKKSYEQSCDKGKNDSFHAREDLPFTRGEWNGYPATDGTCSSPESTNGASNLHGGCQGQLSVSPELLQGGHSRSRGKALNRGGRKDAQTQEVEISRQAQNFCSERIRVDSVEVIERGSGQGLGSVCPDGFVYNIEVEGNHNYFVDDILVHNCHRAAGASFQKIAERAGVNTGDCFYVGCTATARRTDRQSLFAFRPNGERVTLTDKRNRKFEAQPEDCVFQKHVYEYPLTDALEDGWLVPIVGHTVQTDTDLSGVSTSHGDFSEGQLEKAVTNAARTNLAINAWKQVAEQRQTLVFCAGVEHAHHAAGMWQQAGYTAAAIDGTTEKDARRNHLSDFKSGKLQVLCNCGVFTEGTDLPTCSAVVHLRPTKSWNLYVQMTGRGTRTLPGVVNDEMTAEERRQCIATSFKPDCVVIDLVDITKDQDLCSAPSILDLPANMDLQGQSVLATKKMLDEFEEVRDQVIGECPRTYQELAVRLSQVALLRESGAKTKTEWGAIDNGFRFLKTRPGYQCNLTTSEPGVWNMEVKKGQEVILTRKGKPGHDFRAYVDSAARHASEAIERHAEANMPSRGTLTRLSPKQVNVLKANGHKINEIDAMPYAKAKATIDKYMQAWQAKKEQ